MDSFDDGSFVIVVPSNAQPQQHPENTASSFRVTYHDSISLPPGNWEVALLSITYANTMSNIVDESFKLYKLKYPLKQVVPIEKKLMFPGFHEMFAGDWYSPVVLSYDPVIKRYKMKRNDISTIGSAYGLKMETADDMGFYDKSLMPNNVTKEIFDQYEVCPILNKDSQEAVAKNPPGLILEEDLNIYRVDDGYKIPPLTDLEKRRKLYPSERATRTPRKGFYEKPETLLQVLNSEKSAYFQEPILIDNERREKSMKLELEESGLKWSYDPIIRRFIVKVNDNYVIKMNKSLQEILGFEKSTLAGGSIMAKFPPLLNRGIFNIYIYCSLITPYQVGDVKAPLLRSVPAGNMDTWGTVLWRDFNPPLYLPVNATSFNSIYMEMRDDMGELINFDNGRTLITLRFRPRPSHQV